MDAKTRPSSGYRPAGGLRSGCYRSVCSDEPLMGFSSLWTQKHVPARDTALRADCGADANEVYASTNP
ncbi:hypothetical protein [Paenibacillus sp. Y412MC10]|uniref:hypothetical protein n=1 Tax=Geobacillus sp. (strain Y412MC10) TaxID=481743 RepID=UPI0011A91935|nr:hypothetical protein [Paenibacillus sp. Y412MC10]